MIPILKDIHYLDSAATSQKPNFIVDSLKEYYENYNANAGRGTNDLAMKSFEIIENTRKLVSEFINCEKDEIVFTKNATESLNIIAYSYGNYNLEKDDEIMLFTSNHHANLVTWQYVAKNTGAKLVYIDPDENGEINILDIEKKITNRTKILAFSSVVNSIGVQYDVKKILKLAHSYNIITVVDATQEIVHKKINIIDIEADFLVFSGHKIFSSFGVGVLYISKKLHSKMKPFLYGGDMIEYVEKYDSKFKKIPHLYEGGTMDTAAIYTLQKAIPFLEENYKNEITKMLYNYLVEKMLELDFIELYGNVNKNIPILAFNVKNVHSHDVSYILNENKVMIRSGHHCTQPLMKLLNINSCCRVSLSFYNTKNDIDALINALKKVKEIF